MEMEKSVGGAAADSSNLEFLDDLDSYFEDVNDRLTISRMVSDSVLKGMVNAVLQESVERESFFNQKLQESVERKSFFNQKLQESGKFQQDFDFLDSECLGLQAEKQFRDEVELMIIQTSVRTLLQESEEKAIFCGNPQNANLLRKIKELSGLVHELDDAISRCPELGYLFSHGEPAFEESSAKRKDHFHHRNKLLTTHISLPSSFKEGESRDTTTPDMMMESPQLKHMSKDELINYFKTEMTKMKRNHESQLQEVTEEYFSLRREFLKERGPSSSLRKDKDFEALRKKIPQVMEKLQEILAENDKLPVVYENSDIICSLKARIDTLLSENHQLKDLLAIKTKEVKILTSQISNACDKMSYHSLAETNLLKQIMRLKCDIEDTKIEASVRENIFECILRELIGEFNSQIEDSDMGFKNMLEIWEIIFKQFVKDGKATNPMIKFGVEDSDMESIMEQELAGIVFTQAAKDAITTLDLMKRKYEEVNERNVSLEKSLLKTENALNLEIGEKEQVKKEMLLFSALMEEKRKLAVEMSSTLMEEKKRFDQLNQEFSRLTDKASQQEKLISESSKESNLIKSKLEDALMKIHLYEAEISKLEQKLTLAGEDLGVANQERSVLRETIQMKESTLSYAEAKEMEYRKQIESVTLAVQRLFEEAADFEDHTTEAVERNTKRLKLLKVQCDPLVHKTTLFRRMKLAYRQRLNKRYSDLQKAEAEVDLLGDEVDALLSLLEKIYIALDHYSPVLKYYPGIMEILKLIKRELSGETTKSVSAALS